MEPEFFRFELWNDDIRDLKPSFRSSWVRVVVIFVDFETQNSILVDGEGEDQGSDLVIIFGEKSSCEVAVGDGDAVRG